MQVVHEVWKSGGGKTTHIGYKNRRGQKCWGTLGVAGNDHGQYAYKVECTSCHLVYGANGSDLWERKCPKCQDGAPGIRFKP